MPRVRLSLVDEELCTGLCRRGGGGSRTNGIWQPYGMYDVQYPGTVCNHHKIYFFMSLSFASLRYGEGCQAKKVPGRLLLWSVFMSCII